MDMGLFWPSLGLGGYMASLFTPNVSVDNTVLVDGSAVTQPISGNVGVTGTVSVEGGNATAVKVDGSAVTQPVNVTNTVSVITAQAATSTVTQLTSTGVNQVALAANANRISAIFYFETGIWYLKYGAGASPTSLTYKISSNATTIIVTGWTGEIDVLCTTSGKLVDITELS